MKCFFCGNELPDNAQFCTTCGSPTGRIDPKNPKPQVAAAPLVPPVASAPVAAPAPAPQPAPAPAPAPQPQVIVAAPQEQKLMGPWAYFGLQILFSIPLVGFILLIVFSLDNNNLNRRNFARSYWCSLIVGVALVIVAVVLILLLGGTDLIEEIARSI